MLAWRWAFVFLLAGAGVVACSSSTLESEDGGGDGATASDGQSGGGPESGSDATLVDAAPDVTVGEGGSDATAGDTGGDTTVPDGAPDTSSADTGADGTLVDVGVDASPNGNDGALGSGEAGDAADAGSGDGSADAQTLTWYELPGSILAPAPRAAGALVSLGGSLLLTQGGGKPANTWVLDSGTWTPFLTEPTIVANPGSIPLQGSAVASLGGTAVLFGGAGTASPSQPPETWAWGGSSWTLLSPTHSPPGENGGSQEERMAALGSVLVLFDTVSGSTWTWDGTDWARQSPAHSPSAREGFALASFGSTVVLFGGWIVPDGGTSRTYLNDTWTWNGSDWKLESPATVPPPRSDAALFGAGNVLALFGGQNTNFLGDTWTWDGTNWTPLATTSAPRARIYAQAATLGGVGYLFSGLGGSGVTEDSHATWDAWILATAPPPGYTGGSTGEQSIVTRCQASGTAPVLGASVGSNGQTESVGYSGGGGVNNVALTALDDTCGSTGSTATSIRDMLAPAGCNAAFSTTGTTALPFAVATDMGPQPWAPGAWFAEFAPTGGLVTRQLTDAGDALCPEAVAVDTDGGIAFCLAGVTSPPYGWNVAPVFNVASPCDNLSGAFDSKHDLLLIAPIGATPNGAIKLSASDGGVVWSRSVALPSSIIPLAVDTNDDLLLLDGTHVQKLSGATGAPLWQAAIGASSAAPIATDADRNVYVAIQDTFPSIEKFSPSGALISVATLPSGLQLSAIGVDPSGDLVFVAASGVVERIRPY